MFSGDQGLSDFVNASPKFNQFGSLFCPNPMKPLL